MWPWTQWLFKEKFAHAALTPAWIGESLPRHNVIIMICKFCDVTIFTLRDARIGDDTYSFASDVSYTTMLWCLQWCGAVYAISICVCIWYMLYERYERKLEKQFRSFCAQMDTYRNLVPFDFDFPIFFFNSFIFILIFSKFFILFTGWEATALNIFVD